MVTVQLKIYEDERCKRKRKLFAWNLDWSRTTSKEVVRDLLLKEGDCEYSLEELENLLVESEFRIAKERIFAYLSRKRCTCEQVRTKLKEEGYPSPVIEQAVCRVVELGYLNDIEYSASFIRDKQLSGWGQKRIVRELVTRGISEDQIDQVSNDVFNEASELERAVAVLRGRTVENRKEREKLISKLVRRGFSFSIALSAVDTLSEK